MGRQNQGSKQNRRSFSVEFKADAVEIVRTSGKPVAQVARELGVGESTLGYWVNRDRIDRGEKEGGDFVGAGGVGGAATGQCRLRMERDLLKRAVAFWVKETE